MVSMSFSTHNWNCSHLFPLLWYLLTYYSFKLLLAFPGYFFHSLLLTSCKRTLCTCTMNVYIAYCEITVAGESNIFLTLLQLKKTTQHNSAHSIYNVPFGKCCACCCCCCCWFFFHVNAHIVFTISKYITQNKQCKIESIGIKMHMHT